METKFVSCYNLEAAEKVPESFDDAKVRARYIQRVSLLQTVMLCIITAFCSVPFFYPKLHDKIMNNLVYLWITIGSFFFINAIFIFCVHFFKSLKRKLPYNLILFVIITVLFGITVMMICSAYTVVSILIALIITTIFCASIIAFSFQNKYDQVSWLGFGIGILAFLIISGGVGAVAHYKFDVIFPYIGYGIAGAFVIIFLLILDVTLLIRGQHWCDVETDEYIHAAIQAFLDIVIILFIILCSIGLILCLALICKDSGGCGGSCNCCTGGSGSDSKRRKNPEEQ